MPVLRLPDAVKRKIRQHVRHLPVPAQEIPEFRAPGEDDKLRISRRLQNMRIVLRPDRVFRFQQSRRFHGDVREQVYDTHAAVAPAFCEIDAPFHRRVAVQLVPDARIEHDERDRPFTLLPTTRQ